MSTKPSLGIEAKHRLENKLGNPWPLQKDEDYEEGEVTK